MCRGLTSPGAKLADLPKGAIVVSFLLVKLCHPINVSLVPSCVSVMPCCIIWHLITVLLCHPISYSRQVMSH